jgi:hypothetical protein
MAAASCLKRFNHFCSDLGRLAQLDRCEEGRARQLRAAFDLTVASGSNPARAVLPSNARAGQDAAPEKEGGAFEASAPAAEGRTQKAKTARLIARRVYPAGDGVEIPGHTLGNRSRVAGERIINDKTPHGLSPLCGGVQSHSPFRNRSVLRQIKNPSAAVLTRVDQSQGEVGANNANNGAGNR